MLSIDRGLRFSLMILIFCLVTIGASAQNEVQSETESEDYAVLIVGDENDAEMLRREKILIEEFGKRIRGQDSEVKLLFYSYHFNKERERAYCENKLNVLGEDLLFVGIVKLQDRVPQDVVYRIDRIANPARAAKDVLERAMEMIGVEEPAQQEERDPADPTTETSEPSERTEATEPDEKPEATEDEVPRQPTETTPDPGQGSTAAAGSGFRVQFGAFSQLKHAEDQQAKAARGGLQVKVAPSKNSTGVQVYRVVSDRFSSKNEAESFLARAKEAGLTEAIIVRGE